jgi:hypothetical protein
MMDSAGWNGQDPNDFQGFLDLENNLGDLQFDFQDYNSQQNQAGQMMSESMETRMDGLAGQDTTMHELIPSMTTATSHPAIPTTPIAHSLPSSDSLVELDAQIQYLQHQRQQQHQRQMQEQQRNFYAQSRMIPPTPNSVEMHGGSAQFYPQSDPQQQAMYERFRIQVKEQEVCLTCTCGNQFPLTFNHRWLLLRSFPPPLLPSKHTSTFPNTLSLVPTLAL